VLVVHILVLSRFFINTKYWTSKHKEIVHNEQRKIFLSKPPLSLCRKNQGEVRASTDYAVVSLYSGNFALYGSSAIKLAKSITQFTSLDKILMVLSSVYMLPHEYMSFEKAGWIICRVEDISNPPVVKKNNRFLEAKLYSKFNAWRLVEYKAVLLMDSDTLAVGNPAVAFQQELPLMIKTNKTLGAARDLPYSPCRFGFAPQYFNAGVLLLIPNLHTFQFLNSSISTVPHDTDWAEQSLLNVLYHDNTKETNLLFHELPFEYNANVIAKVCEPTLWRSTDIKIVHYTTAKGWMYSKHWESLKDPFECWWWDVQDLCLLWETT